MLLETAKEQLKAAVEAKDSPEMAAIVTRYLEFRGHIPKGYEDAHFLACTFLMEGELSARTLMWEFKFSFAQAAEIRVDLRKLWEYRDYDFTDTGGK